MKLRKIIEALFKVSPKYWNSLNKMEQDYIKERINIDGLSQLKSLLSSAKKQFGTYDKIWGKGFIEKDGEIYLWTGWDTKKFRKV